MMVAGSLSAKDNDQLIDYLIQEEYIRTSAVQRIFRVVDRGNYYEPDQRIHAYKDSAFKMEHLHLSAPSVYAVAMEALELKPGLSFLNLGSGSGYFSTMAGLILGQYGTNHGIEYHANIVDYADERLNEFIKTSKAVDEYDFCEPEFTCGNCLTIDNNSQRYDRVYCGAACPPEYENYMKNLVRINGILVMPVRNSLFKIQRVDERTWQSKKILSVLYSPLIQPDVISDGKEPHIKLSDIAPPKLQELCRSCIRSQLRKIIIYEQPTLVNKDYRLSMKYIHCSDIEIDLNSDDELEDGKKSFLNVSGIRNSQFLQVVKDIMLLKVPGKCSRKRFKERVVSNEMNIMDPFIFSPFPISECIKNTDIAEEQFITPPSLSTRSKKRKYSFLETGLESGPSCSASSLNNVKIIKNSVKLNLEGKIVKEHSYSYFITEKIQKLRAPNRLLIYINSGRNNF